MKSFARIVLLSSMFAVNPVVAVAADDCKMDPEHMAAMSQHTEEMQNLMGQIKKESDPEKRKSLMRQHMKEMQAIMAGMDHGDMHGSAAACGSASGAGGTARLNLLEERVNLLQAMLNQMLERQTVYETPYLDGRGRPQ